MCAWFRLLSLLSLGMAVFMGWLAWAAWANVGAYLAVPLSEAVVLFALFAILAWLTALEHADRENSGRALREWAAKWRSD